MTKAEIARHAAILLGCYRTGEANDPAIYSGAVIAVLSDYPLEIIRAVVDPRKGLPSRCKWLPTVAEIKEACEAEHAPIVRRVEQQHQVRRQLEDRALLEAPRENRPTYEDLIQRCVDAGLPMRPKETPRISVDAVKAKFGISDEAWNAIPNAKARS